MVNAGPDPSSGNNGPAAGAAERLRAARYVLIAAALLLFGGALFFALPLAYPLAGVVVLILVAASLPRPRADWRSEASGRSGGQVWPDTAMKATVEAFPRAAFVLDAGGAVRYANETAGRLFPATRPGDAFTLTFRRPEFSEALEIAGAGQATSVEFRQPLAKRPSPTR